MNSAFFFQINRQRSLNIFTVLIQRMVFVVNLENQYSE